MPNAAAERAAEPAGLTGRPVYELRGVGKTYARRVVHALDNIDLTLARAAFRP